MGSFWIFSSILMVLINVTLLSGSNVYVVHAPSHLKLHAKRSDELLKVSDFEKLILAANGFKIMDTEWCCFHTTNALLHPKVTIIFITSGEQNLDDAFSSKIKLHDDIPLNFELLENSYAEKSKTFDSSAIKKHFYTQKLVAELLKDLDTNCRTHKSLVYIIKFGDESVAEIIKAIDTIMTEFKLNCVDTLKDNLLVYLLHEDKIDKRARREAPNDPQPNNITNTAVFYSDDYPVAFNLFFWTSLIIALAVFSTSCYLWNMDPGTDTVIYRMTSQRIKKNQ